MSENPYESPRELEPVPAAPHGTHPGEFALLLVLLVAFGVGWAIFVMLRR